MAPAVAPDPLAPGTLYLDACATTPLAPEAWQAMEAAWRESWGNPSSLHGPGLAAAEALERGRWQVAEALGAAPEEVVWCSGGTEAIQTALLGSAATLPPGRLVISAVEHPATETAAAVLAHRGWTVARAPVDRQGLLRLDALEPLLAPPTRLVSVIWGQSEVGSVQPLAALGSLCRERGLRLHVDAVQVLGHASIDWSQLPADLLSGAAHKLQGPRGIGLLLVRRGLPLEPLIGGGQEAGRRGGTEPVPLIAGFSAALRLCQRRLHAHEGRDPAARLRDALWRALRDHPGLELLGPPPEDDQRRLPHHLSLLVRGQGGRPLPGRALVRALARRGVACGSGSACSALGGGPGAAATAGALATAGAAATAGASRVLLAMGFSPEEASAGLRLSVGPWLREEELARVPAALAEAIAEVDAALPR
ncbi:MAG: cysteine desulfurase family protein [Cyanobacteriota bacterium]|nr:cysteine desulfurase family protein [Cyanobacteriota bacterium]